MNFTYRKQSQFELFPGNQTAASDQHKSRYPFSELIISPENMIIVCIGLLMSFVLLFSLGVERGKTAKRVVAPAPKINSAQNKTPAIITPQLPQTAAAVNQGVPQTIKVAAVTAGQVNKIPVKVVVPNNVQPKALGRYTIQVASYKLEKSAQQEAARLKNLGFDAATTLKGSHYIVCVGLFADNNEAQKFTKKLKSKYKDSVVRRI